MGTMNYDSISTIMNNDSSKELYKAIYDQNLIKKKSNI